jgi:hypothetical protein
MSATCARSASPSDEVALASFDNDAWTERVSPGVKIIAQPVYVIGKNGMQLSPQRLAYPSMSTRTLALPGELVIRGATERSADSSPLRSSSADAEKRRQGSPAPHFGQPDWLRRLLACAYLAARAASMIAAATSVGFDSIGMWLASTFTTVAPICCAIAPCNSGDIMRSFSVTTNHDRLLCHAA